MLYAHSGSMMDRLLEVNGMLAFEIEVRGPSFDPPPETIEKAGEEIFAGIMALAKTQYTQSVDNPKMVSLSLWERIFPSRPNASGSWDTCTLFVFTVVFSSVVSFQSFFFLANI